VKTFAIALALLAALLVQSATSRVFPGGVRYLDPLLLVLVYCGLVGGATRGMLVGAVAGWIQDVHFGGRVLGLLALTKLLIGYVVGLSSTRFHLAEPTSRALVIFLATVADALTLRGLAAVFEVEAYTLSPAGLLVRGIANALLGVILFEAVERRRSTGTLGS
jgi:rod shape-determining protein MreD